MYDDSYIVYIEGVGRCRLFRLIDTHEAKPSRPVRRWEQLRPRREATGWTIEQAAAWARCSAEDWERGERGEGVPAGVAGLIEWKALSSELTHGQPFSRRGRAA